MFGINKALEDDMQRASEFAYEDQRCMMCGTTLEISDELRAELIKNPQDTLRVYCTQCGNENTFEVQDSVEPTNVGDALTKMLEAEVG